jgi:hypothetical protein
MIIFVKNKNMEPISKKVYIKRHYAQSEFMKSMKIDGALFQNTKVELVAPIDSQTKKVKTGFEKWSKEKVAEFEEELSLAPGTLKNPEFWADFKITIPPTGKWIDLGTPEGRLEYMVLCQIKTVAKSLEELPRVASAANMQYSAVFVMRDAEQEATKKVSKAHTKKKAYAIADKMGPEEMANYLIYIGETPQNMSRDVIEGKMYEDLDSNPDRFLSIIEKENFKDVVFINKCLHNNILSQRGQAIYHGGQVMSSNLEAAIEFLNDPTNHAVKLALHADLDSVERKSQEVKLTKPKRQ